MVIQQYLAAIIGTHVFDADTVYGQACACKSNYCNHLNFTKTVIAQREHRVSQTERHTSQPESYTSQAERHSSQAEWHSSQGEWHSSYYTKALKSVVTDSAMNIPSRRKSTTQHLELSDVTTMEKLSTPSFAAGLVKSNQMLITTLSVLYLACLKLLV